MYKKVKVITDDNQEFIGIVESWSCEVTNAEEHNIEENSIDIIQGGVGTVLYQNEIKSIEEI